MEIGRAMANFVFVELRLFEAPVSVLSGDSVAVLWAVLVSDADIDDDVDVDVVEEEVEEVELVLEDVVIEVWVLVSADGSGEDIDVSGCSEMLASCMSLLHIS